MQHRPNMCSFLPSGFLDWTTLPTTGLIKYVIGRRSLVGQFNSFLPSLLSAHNIGFPIPKFYFLVKKRKQKCTQFFWMRSLEHPSSFRGRAASRSSTSWARAGVLAVLPSGDSAEFFVVIVRTKRTLLRCVPQTAHPRTVYANAIHLLDGTLDNQWPGCDYFPADLVWLGRNQNGYLFFCGRPPAGIDFQPPSRVTCCHSIRSVSRAQRPLDCVGFLCEPPVDIRIVNLLPRNILFLLNFN